MDSLKTKTKTKKTLASYSDNPLLSQLLHCGKQISLLWLMKGKGTISELYFIIIFPLFPLHNKIFRTVFYSSNTAKIRHMMCEKDAENNHPCIYFCPALVIVILSGFPKYIQLVQSTVARTRQEQV